MPRIDILQENFANGFGQIIRSLSSVFFSSELKWHAGFKDKLL